ncbi:hypothetical protein [Asticcacaulis taihuensis]|jgi:hypothetical protein|uniref:hypothetical protein n=1 Tax=Asticcacaulis taihuensis TaxID=260084 RepID=UPI003F7C9116
MIETRNGEKAKKRREKNTCSQLSEQGANKARGNGFGRDHDGVNVTMRGRRQCAANKLHDFLVFSPDTR